MYTHLPAKGDTNGLMSETDAQDGHRGLAKEIESKADVLRGVEPSSRVGAACHAPLDYPAGRDQEKGSHSRRPAEHLCETRSYAFSHDHPVNDDQNLTMCGDQT